jgi:hypothetical protein
MFYKANVAVWSEIHIKHINIICGQNVEVLNVKPEVRNKQRVFEKLRQFLGINGVGLAQREVIHIYGRQQDNKKKGRHTCIPCAGVKCL